MSYSKYAEGFKWCSGCAKFIKTEEIKCPICKTQLRVGPKASKLKRDRPRVD